MYRYTAMHSHCSGIAERFFNTKEGAEGVCNEGKQYGICLYKK